MVAGHLPRTSERTAVPLPRRPPDRAAAGDDQVRRWYENELGWPTVPASTPESPVRLRVGPRFDVLDVPAEAGRAALRHLAGASPVALRGDRVRLLVAAGSAEELPGILEWLEWGSLPLDLRAIGADGSMTAPALPGAVPGGPAGAAWGRMPGGLAGATRQPGTGAWRSPRAETTGLTGAAPGRVPAGSAGRSAAPGTGGPVAAAPPGGEHAAPGALQGAAVWLRPPEPGCEVEASLPTVSALGGGGGAPDLVRVVNTVATHCHRLRLRGARAQAFADPGLRAPLDQALAFS
ncbi:SCO3374 family protein [Streptomyces sp. NPDC091972]|uniref:SCO3374 family protein n=1 Tax=Streptomyces sp. NPDC091972 TaxID=3366007 RepID=UPI003830B3D5